MLRSATTVEQRWTPAVRVSVPMGGATSIAAVGQIDNREVEGSNRSNPGYMSSHHGPSRAHLRVASHLKQRWREDEQRLQSLSWLIEGSAGLENYPFQDGL